MNRVNHRERIERRIRVSDLWDRSIERLYFKKLLGDACKWKRGEIEHSRHRSLARKQWETLLGSLERRLAGRLFVVLQRTAIRIKVGRHS